MSKGFASNPFSNFDGALPEAEQLFNQLITRLHSLPLALDNLAEPTRQAAIFETCMNGFQYCLARSYSKPSQLTNLSPREFASRV